MPDAERLTLSPDEMRALGYRAVDLIVDHLQNLADTPVSRDRSECSRPRLEALLREPLPQQGSDPLAVLERVQRDILTRGMHIDHPRFFAFVPGPGNFVGAMADALVSGLNVYSGTWLEGAGAAQVELVVIDWLREACGLPSTTGGLFVSGGSVANLTALAVARHRYGGGSGAPRNGAARSEGPRAVVYCSDQTHSSVDRALRLLGFGADQLRRLESDAGYRLDLACLRRAVDVDRAAGLDPFCVVANAGTVNTGAVDPLPELAEYCHAEGLWLHVDGAYGAAAVMSRRGRARLSGLGAADSVTLDPHKWLFQPYEMGCVLVRDDAWLVDTFRILPEYLLDIAGEAGQVNYCDRGIQLSRGFRALKLWMSLQVFGAAAFGAAQEHGMALAETAEAAVRGLPGWEVVTPAQMGIVTFRCAPAELNEAARDRLNRRIVAAVVDSGYAMISTTVLRGHTVLRLCPINPRTTEADVIGTVQRLREAEQGRS